MIKRRLLVAMLGALVAARMPSQTWQRVADSAAPTAVIRAIEVGGSELALIDGGVVRRRGSDERMLEPTAGAPVRPLTLCSSPGGATFVAAANGVFVTHPEVSTLDRVDFAHGGPQGPVVGLVADRIDRLWVATETQFFAVHAGLWFHIEHTVADGLPRGPFTALAIDANGSLLLHSAGAVHSYRPDPEVPRLDQADVVAVGPGGLVELACRGSAGAIGFRCRESSHHILRDARHAVDLRSPGRHDLLVYAIDRDLDLSVPIARSVEVPFGSGLGVRHVILASVLLALVLAAWRFSCARSLSRSWWRAGVDAGLMLVVTLQLGMAMTSVGRTWPFIGFTMYGEVYEPSSVLFTPALVMRARAGGHAAHEGVFTFATDGVWRQLASLYFATDEVRRAFVDGLGADVDAVELRIRRCRLTPAGPREVAPWVLARLGGEGRR